MILDANVLLYAVDSSSPHHDGSRDWLEEALNGHRRVGFPWQTLGAFVRISTHPRVMTSPLRCESAREFVDEWLDNEVAWIPPVDEKTWHVLRELLADRRVTGNLVTDAQLAAVALQHGVPVVSTDSDFARFRGLEWIDPLA